MKAVLSIAGFDPSSGAGITADLMVFAAHGLFGTSCITALTVQSTRGVLSTHPVDDAIIARTLDCLDADLRPAGVKIGMVANEPNIFIISEYIATLNVIVSNRKTTSGIPVILDPVVRSSSGRELLDASGLAALRRRLLPLVDWVTPNLDELALLLDRRAVGRGEVQQACRALQSETARPNTSARPLGIVATGGHLDPPDDFLLMPSGEGIWLPGERVATQSTHGTGCAFSSAFLSRLVHGDEPKQAAQAAKAYVAGALRSATSIGNGTGPLNHLWNVVP